MPRIRLVTPGDAPVLTDLALANREFLAPWNPARDDDHFTLEKQAALVSTSLASHAAGTQVPYVVLNDSEQVIGCVTLQNIVRGPLQSASLGYWLDSAHNGRGLASEAVQDMLVVAFDELKLHRLEAGTLVHNVRSQRVLERHGFKRYGLAPEFLKIQGRWQDHVLFQLLSPHDV